MKLIKRQLLTGHLGKTERFKLKGQKGEPSSARIVHREGLAVAHTTTSQNY